MCMNLKLGGEGGWDHVNQPGNWGGVANLKNPEVLKKTKNSFSKNHKEKFGTDSEYTKKFSDYQSKHSKNSPRFSGKTHSNESKQKISEGMKGKQSGNKNSQFGTCWINKAGIAKKISKA